MQIPWHSLRKPASRRAVAWPPSGVQWLASVMAGVFVAQWVLSRGAAGGWDPIEQWGALSLAGLRAGQFWRLGTHLFLERNPGAEFTELLVLYVCGRHLEAITGRRHLLQLFFLAGILGGLARIGQQLAGSEVLPVTGATPAVVGVFFALTSVMPELELAPFGGFHAPPRLKIKHCALGVILVCVGLVLADTRGVFARDEALRCLAGSLAGWIYMRQLGFGRWGLRANGLPRMADVRASVPVPQAVRTPVATATATAFAQVAPRFTEREMRMTPRQYISEQIDPILDKICLHGIAALTTEERRILEKARDKMGQKGA